MRSTNCLSVGCIGYILINLFFVAILDTFGGKVGEQSKNIKYVLIGSIYYVIAAVYNYNLRMLLQDLGLVIVYVIFVYFASRISELEVSK